MVRSDSSVASEARTGRLAIGAVVKELDLCNDRLHYVLVSGEGPEIGWVSTRLRGRDLLVREGERQQCPERSSRHSGEECTGAACEAKKDPKEEEYEALKDYERKFGEALGDHVESINRKRFPLKGDELQKGTEKETPAEAMEAALAFKGKRTKKRVQTLWDIDSDGEDVPLCACCFMPVGEFAYKGDLVERLPPHNHAAKQKCAHSECMALLMLENAQFQEEERVKKENQKKLANRLQYGIGWRMGCVPKNTAIAQRLGCSPVPNGLCCLVYDEAARTVRIAATHEPAASVNLEYLMLALKVRRDVNREPLFSLDPVDVSNLEKTLQKKRYEPSWLAGTSVGDVMFEADYFLKELSLGEYTMPVVGMLSVFDLSDIEAKHREQEWAGREWFVVKKAEVRMAADKTLIPHVKMGVEAREQTVGNARLEDKPVTNPNHPLKKFADSFTRNFDLISERKSVIYHLRELAKASVMAKFLLDSKAHIDSNWYQVADAIVKSTKPEAHPQIPQLWNMRGNTSIQLKDGQLESVATGIKSSLRGIYGGVQFGLDKFQLSQRQQGLPAKASLSQSMGRLSTQGMQIGPGAGGRQLFVPERFQIGQRDMAPSALSGRPQGVDLNLDQFSLSELDRFSGTLPPCSAPLDSREGRVTLGRAFLEKLHEGSLQGLKEDDKAFLKALFNPALSDRAEEGNYFNPPDPDLSYVAKVRNLVNEEKCILQRRKLCFFDKSFKASNAGPEFPTSWTSRFQIEKGGQARQPLAAGKVGLLEIQVDSAFQQALLNDVLPSAAPEFQKLTEDGVTFRIYRLGSLEIRTTQEANCKEIVGAVFSRRAPEWQLRSGPRARQAHENEMVVRAKVYTEVAEPDASSQADMRHSGDAKPACHFYVVLETNTANTVVAEQLKDESITWAVNPNNLEDRNSLAKLLFAAEAADGEAPRVQELKCIESANSSKAYAKALLKSMSDFTFQGKWGGKARKEPTLQLPAGRSELPTLPSSFSVSPKLEEQALARAAGTIWGSKKADASRKTREPRRRRGSEGL